MLRKVVTISYLSIFSTLFISCGQQEAHDKTSSSRQATEYVNRNDLDAVFNSDANGEYVEVKDSQYEAASLKLTNGVNEAFSNAGLDVGNGQVDNIVGLILNVFTAITSGDMSSVMAILNDLIAMIVGVVGGGDEGFALADSTNNVVSDVVSVLLESLSALMSGDIDAFVNVMLEFIGNLVGGLA